MYDAERDEVAPFEDFMGSHGGLGGPQTHPFAVIPADWGEPPRRSSAWKRCTRRCAAGSARSAERASAAQAPGTRALTIQVDAGACSWPPLS